MAQQTHLTTQHSYDSPLKASRQALKLKAQLKAYFLRHSRRIARALSSAKTFLADLLDSGAPTAGKNMSNYIAKLSRKRRRKMLVKSTAMRCNWRSNHVIPIPESAGGGVGSNAATQAYYDSTWNSVVAIDDDVDGYLRWLEEKDSGSNGVGDDCDDDDASGIDRLAERFIARCHEKFRLEKQESYRRYQEMLARST